MEQTNEITGALIKAQSEFPEIKKDGKANIPTKTGGSYSYQYATLPEILRAVGPALRKNNLALIQTMSNGEDGGGIQAELLHTSGQRIVSRLPIDFNTYGGSPQQLGSLLTYYRRYLVTALLNLAADEDDDAQAAQGWNPPESRGPVTYTKNPSKPVTVPQLKRLWAISQENRWNEVQLKEVMRQKWGIDNSKELTMGQYDELCKLVTGQTFDQWAAETLEAPPNPG